MCDITYHLFCIFLNNIKCLNIGVTYSVVMQCCPQWEDQKVIVSAATFVWRQLIYFPCYCYCIRQMEMFSEKYIIFLTNDTEMLCWLSKSEMLFCMWSIYTLFCSHPLVQLPCFLHQFIRAILIARLQYYKSKTTLYVNRSLFDVFCHIIIETLDKKLS